MSLKSFLKDRILAIIIFLVTVVFIGIFLYSFSVHTFLMIYVPTTLILLLVVILLLEYMRRKSFYDSMKNQLDKLDKKYYIQELLKRPDFIEGKIMYEAMYEINKSMVENVNKHLYKEKEYRDYIELWVHEIKTPIASSKLIIENNKNNVTSSIDEELNRVNNFVEQALYYARSNVVEKDYIIKKYNLRSIINSVIKQNKKDLIGKKIKIELFNLDFIIHTDMKWIEYIINQVIINSIKYSKADNAYIKIYAEQQKDKIQLYIEDNGIGILKNDLNKVFDKGFTGTNGRKYSKSTGMGLYLCKKLLLKLGQDINIESDEMIGTKICISFPINSFVDNII